MTLTLSACKVSEEFTCSNGQCIQLFKRCDKKTDCDDKSDESNCENFVLQHGYDKDVPPTMDGTTKVNVTIDILNVNKVDTHQRKVELTYKLKLYWIENRMTFQNIIDNQSDSYSKKDLSKKRSHLWDPFTKLLHYNSIIGTVDYEEESKKVSVKVRNEPIGINPEMSWEEIEYPGMKAIVMERMRVRATYECFFDLFRFPFDTQVCEVLLKIQDFSNVKMELLSKPNSVRISGPKKLQDFTITNWTSYSVENQHGKKFQMSLTFERLYKQQMTAIYLQMMLLWTVCYFTLYIDVHDFSNRFMGSVTALLVLCALMDAINQRLPTSADIKLVDIWIVWFVFQIILITFSHVLINWLLKRDPELTLTMKKFVKAFFLVLNMAFVATYVLCNIWYEEENEY